MVAAQFLKMHFTQFVIFVFFFPQYQHCMTVKSEDHTTLETEVRFHFRKDEGNIDNSGKLSTYMYETKDLCVLLLRRGFNCTRDSFSSEKGGGWKFYGFPGTFTIWTPSFLLPFTFSTIESADLELIILKL